MGQFHWGNTTGEMSIPTKIAQSFGNIDQILAELDSEMLVLTTCYYWLKRGNLTKYPLNAWGRLTGCTFSLLDLSMYSHIESFYMCIMIMVSSTNNLDSGNGFMELSKRDLLHKFGFPVQRRFTCLIGEKVIFFSKEIYFFSGSAIGLYLEQGERRSIIENCPHKRSRTPLHWGHFQPLSRGSVRRYFR